MMNHASMAMERLRTLEWVGIGLVAAGLFVAAYAAVDDEQSFAHRAWHRYVESLDDKLEELFSGTSGKTVAIGQVAAAFGVLLISALVSIPYWYVALTAVLVGPTVWIERRRRQRVEAIESQLDGFLVALANALKSTPSLGDALISVQKLIPPPLGLEVELAVKEMRLARTLPQVVSDMAARINSRQVDSALSAILIGRQVGGDLPMILETTAATLREMARLEGVVRTKTAEGKVQMWVLAIFPLGLVLALNAMKPDYFDPLTNQVWGYLVVSVAAGFWIISLVTARKILQVDL